MNEGEIVIYQSADNPEFQIEVRVDDETVWLTQSQMVELFNSTKQNISLHINNIYREKELQPEATVKEYLTVRIEGERTVNRKVALYNLDVIISVGYRVKSQRGTQFRIWANKILKEYLLKGYALNQRFEKIEGDVWYLKNKIDEIDFQIKTNLPPNEGIFFDGQVFDAWQFVSSIVENAEESITLIDNYIDESVLTLLLKRKPGVTATIYSANISKQFQLDLEKHNTQYPFIQVFKFDKSHDRFLITDNKTVYHIGASLKDLGKKWFAFSKIQLDASDLLNKLTSTNQEK